MKSPLAYQRNFIKFAVILIFSCTGFKLYAQMNTSKVLNDFNHGEIAGEDEDNVPKLYVRNIIIEGNRKTKQYIIEREMHINAGDSIITWKLENLLEQARQNVYNTTLFVDVW